MASPTLCTISSRPETTAQLLCARSSETRGASLARTWSEALWSFVKTSGAQKSDCFGNSNAADITPTTVYGVLSNAIVLPMTAGSDPNRSEERRVGKECRSRWAAYSEKKREGYRAGHM